VVIESKVEGSAEVRTVENIGDNLRENLTDEDTNAPYAGSYLKDIFAFRNRGVEEEGLRSFPQRFVEPFQFLMVPQVVYAGVSFGLIIAG